MKKARVLTVVGTRPEAIKMVPVIRALAPLCECDSRLCVTAQHRGMLDQVLEVFGLVPDYDLNVMRPDQTLAGLGASILERLDPILEEFRPNMVLVHGDTLTSLYATLAAFYRRVAVGHVEAGLRTGDLQAPWPEEANRRLTGVLATSHFVPTPRSRRNLLLEGVHQTKVVVTGNTVIDTLFLAQTMLERNPELKASLKHHFGFLRPAARLVLITGHRRESLGGGFERIGTALRQLAQEFPDDDFLYPVHLNPRVREPIQRLLGDVANVHLVDPVDYLPFVYLMSRSYLILTDSGGIQEEAPSLGKPVLVMRDTTERPEAVEAGTVRLVGTAVDSIVNSTRALLTDDAMYQKMARAHNPYGDGKASQRIVSRIAAELGITMTESYESVSVVGLGYIGLPTAAALSKHGLRVIGVDINKETVATINRGETHIIEPQLDAAVRQAVSSGRLRATTEPEPADAFLIAVPTPFRGDHEPDLSFVEAAARRIAPALRVGTLVVLESTCPVGSTAKLAEWLAEERADLTFPQQCGERSDIRIAHCPERVLPGQVMRELEENDRIIGGLTARCSRAALALYRLFVAGECIVTDAATAELCKLTENSFRDVNIAFANELSMICAKLGVDIWELTRLANRHPRVNILQPGPGVGGHCIAVDPWFIVHSAPQESNLIRAARVTNDRKPKWVIDRVIQELAALAAQTQQSTTHLHIACLGLAFKANIDDLRESPALKITETLAELFPEQVVAVEPNIRKSPARLAQLGVRLVSLQVALAQADVVVLLVDHKEFASQPVFDENRQRIVDTRGIWSSPLEASEATPHGGASTKPSVIVPSPSASRFGNGNGADESMAAHERAIVGTAG